MKYFLLFSLILLLSCKKETTETLASYEASYKATITMNWKMPQFTVPENAHVTSIIGMIHSKDTFLWNTGKPATIGLENVAEVGDNNAMNAQLDTILAHQKALSKFTLARPAITGIADTVFTFNTDFSYISFASMIAPSPDWFMGIHDINLFQNGNWINDLTLNILVYDAGTEDGDIFSYDNPSTVPQQNIQLLTMTNGSALANGNTAIAPIGTIRFTKN